MHDARRVRRRQRVRNLDGVVQRVPQRQSFTADPVRERFPLHVLHDDRVPPVLGDEVVKCDDVRVVQGRGRARLAQETPPPLRVAGGQRRQYLDRHGPVQARVPGFVDLSHATRAGERHNFVRAQPAAGGNPDRVRSQRPGRHLHGRRFPETGDFGIAGQHALDFPSQVRIATASLVEKRCPFAGGLRLGLMIDPLDL